MITTKDFLIALDLYNMRYKIGVKWYETFDVLRDYLINNNHTVEFKKDTLIFDGINMSVIITGDNKNGV